MKTYNVNRNTQAETIVITSFETLEEARTRYEEEAANIAHLPLVEPEDNTGRYLTISLDEMTYDAEGELAEMETLEETPQHYEK